MTAQREKEIWDSFYKVIDICEEKQIDLLLIAGDLISQAASVERTQRDKLSFWKIISDKGRFDCRKS